MSKGSEHIDQVFREKLGQYESPVPAHLLANIHAAREKKRDKGFLPFRWLWMGGIALLLIGGSAIAWTAFNQEELPEPNELGARSTGATTSLEEAEQTDVRGEALSLDASTADQAGPSTSEEEGEAPSQEKLTLTKVEEIPSESTVLESIQSSTVSSGSLDTESIESPIERPVEIFEAPSAATAPPKIEDELQERGVGELPLAQEATLLPLLPGLDLAPVATDQAAELPPSSQCASFKEKLDWRWVWFIEGYAGPEFGVRTLSPRTPEAVEYAQLREGSEEVRTSFSTGIRLAAVTPFGLSIRSGLQYTQLNERFDYLNSDELREVITNIYNSQGDFIRTDTTYEAGTRIKTTYNRYRLVDLPLTLGYELNYPKFTLAVHGGPVINFLFTQKGDFLSEEGIPVTFTNGAPEAVEAFQDQLGLSFTGAVGLHYRLNTDIQVILEPHFRYIPQSFTLASYPLDQSYFTTGVSAGIRVRL